MENKQTWFIDEAIFNHPFTCLLAGPTGAGKTVLLNNILLNKNILVEPKITRIVYCYNSWQPNYDIILNSSELKIEFFHGLFDIDSFDKNQNNLLILDDLMDECENSKVIKKLFTVDSHHNNISVFLITQNIFPKGKCARDISLNSHYIIIFKNPRDMNQVGVLGRQMFPFNCKFFLEAYQDATENKAHGYLFIDLKQTTDQKNRIQTGIIPGDERIIYTSNN